ncbi:MAG: DUF4241 domain-containing protein [Myxococcota bacterium]
MEPTERVKRFIEAYEAAYDGLPESLDLTVWARLVPALEEAHFVPGMSSGLDTQLGSPCLHSLDDETILGFSQHEDRVVVETSTSGPFFAYVLEPVEGDWRILRIDAFLDAEGTLFLDADAETRLLSSPEGGWVEAQEDDEPHRWFSGQGLAHVLEEGNPHPQSSEVTVCTLGSLHLSTGALVLGDFAYGASALRALQTSVPVGQWPVEVAIAFGRHAAVRIRFQEGEHARYCEGTLDDGGFVLGIDAGLVMLDASALVGLTAREKAKAFDAYTSAEPPCGHWVSFANAHDGVVVDSGWGEGGYPVYVSMNAEGELLSIYVDFMLGWPPGVEPRPDPS